MAAQIELEVYQHLVGYLNGKEDLESFRIWFDRHTWDRHSWNSPLIGQVELALAELSSRHRTEEEFRDVLQSSLPRFTRQLSPALKNLTIQKSS